MADLSTYVSDQRAIRIVDWPGVDKPVGILLLRCEDVQDAAFEARARFERKRHPVDGTFAELFRYEWEYQLVARMLVDPEQPGPEGRLMSGDQARASLTPDQVAWFLSQHGELRAEESSRLGLSTAGDDA